MDEISHWGDFCQQKRLDLCTKIGRRRQLIEERTFSQDQLGRRVLLPDQINRIVSLVPSLTQTLIDFGLGNKIVGVTGFCPREQLDASVIGGTKNVKTQKVKDLKPDLILASKEENTLNCVKELEESQAAVWVSDPNSLHESVEMVFLLNQLSQNLFDFKKWFDDFKVDFSKVYQSYSGTACYLIWKDPYMAAAKNTFIDNWLSSLGFENIFSNQSRYPETSLQEIVSQSPAFILLPDEPFHFTRQHIAEIQDAVPTAKVILVDGKSFTWQGTTMASAAKHFAINGIERG